MINKIIHFSIYRRNVVFFLATVLVIAGWMAFQKLPIDAVPDITNVQVQINTIVEGLAPEEIERNITVPIETTMNGITGVTQVRSITRFGLSQVTVVFEDDMDIYRARQLISERLQSISGDMPQDVQPQMGPISTGLGEIFYYSVEATDIKQGEARLEQLMELKALQDWYIKPRLLTVKGVAEVNAIGGFEKQFHIQPKAELLSRYGLHFDDIEEAIEKSHKNVGGGYIQQTGEQFIVQGVGLLQNIEDIKAVTVKSLETFQTITIGDIADVKLASELRTGAALVNGKESVLGIAFMLMGENSRTVSLRVAEKLEEIKKGLPKGVKVETLYDRSELVNATLGTVEHNLLTGAGLVVIILLILVGNIRAALITAMTIPLSLLFTFIIMKWQGISGNLMILGALDFGIIVDGTVIVLDNCVRVVHEKTHHLKRALTKAELKETIFDATVEIRQAAGYGGFIIMVVFIPIFALTGIEGKMFIPMAATFVSALFGSIVISFTLAPALASVFLSAKAEDKEPWVMRKITKFYVPILDKSLRSRSLISGVAIVSILLGIFLFSRLGGEFLPQLNEGSIALHMIRPVNVSLDQSVAIQALSEDLIRKEFPEVQTVFSRIGTAEIATDPMGVNVSDTYVMLKDRDEWPLIDGKKQTKDELVQRIAKALGSTIPGQRLVFSQPIQMRFNELLEGTRADVSVKVFGDDMDELAKLTLEIQGVVSRVSGSGDVETELKGTSPMLRIIPKKDLLHQYGITSEEVLEVISAALGGHELGFLYDGVKRFPIVLRLNEQDRSDLEKIKKLPVGVAASLTVPLEELAEIKFVEAYSSVSRENSKRRSAVLINPRGRDTESFVIEAQALADSKVKMPAGYFSEWGGNFKNLQQARSRLMILAPLALLLVFFMIYTAFKDVKETVLIFLCVPLSLVGGVLGLNFIGLPFSISAGVGFIALSGIAVLNGVVLISYFNQLRQQGLNPADAVRKGTIIRLRPVLMTALVDIFGFLPMLLSQDVGAEVQKPLASVVIGGIISSTILTLIVLPMFYAWITKTTEDVEI
jgi:cobalt-zinc-cadmium resistance protein CzcA